MFLLDTSILSDVRKRASLSLMAWLEGQNVSNVAISVVTILELERGIQRKERSDTTGARPLRAWLEADVRPLFRGRILSVDDETATDAAALHIPDPMPEMDALIAATALVHGLVLVTRNTRDFQRVQEHGLKLLDPWNM